MLDPGGRPSGAQFSGGCRDGDQELRLRPTVRFRSESFGAILYDRESLDYVLVNRLGHLILRIAQNNPALSGVVARVATEYPARPTAVIDRDVRAFIADLGARGVLDNTGGTVARPSGDRYPYPILGASVPVKEVTLRSLKAPLIAQLAVIFTCNLLCKHCYTSSTAEHRSDTLTFAEICAVIDDVAANEVFDLSLTGGEALLRPDIFEIISHAKRYPLFVNLNTNGTPISPKVAGRLRDSGLDQARVSIDSADPRVHDAFRGRPGALTATLRGIRRLLDAGIRTEVHATLSAEASGSRDDVNRLIELSRQAGVARISFGAVNAVGRADTDDRELKLANDRLRSVIEYVEELAAADPFVGGAPHAQRARFPGIPDYDGCGNCLDSPLSYINYNGSMYPCAGMYKPKWALGSVRDRSFSDIWRGSPVLAGLRASAGPRIDEY